MKSKILTFFLKRIPILLFLGIYFVLSLLTYRDYGLTMDEFFVYTRGEYFYTKVKGNDPLLQKGFAIKEKANHNLLYYNSTYSAVLYALNDSQSYENYHLLNMFFASVVFYLLYEALLLATGKPMVAIIGPIFLFFTPRFLGHIPANPKDVPFTVAYFLSLFFIFLHSSLNPRLRTILIGLSIGLTASLRMVGFILIPIYFLFVIFLQWELIKKNKLRESQNLFYETVQVFIIAFFLFMVSMPYVAADPFNHTLELLKVNKLYPWSGTVFFMGREYAQNEIPLHYLPVWLAITTPLFIIFLSGLSFFRKMGSKISALRLLIIISLATQMILYFAMQPVIYNGMRHYLFLLPQLVVLAVIGLYSLRTSSRWFKPVIGLTIFNMAFILFYYVQFHPYQYTFFNSFAGSIYKAESYFETDYWGGSDRETLLWLKEYSKSQGEVSPRIFLCSKSRALNYYYPEAIDSNHNIYKADYIVCYDKRQISKYMKKIEGEVIFEVKRSGIVFNSVYKVK